MSFKSFYWKTRTLLSGDYREIEANCREMNNRRIMKKYKNKKDVYGILRIHTDEGGLVCILTKVLAGIQYCSKHNLIPVVDTQTRYNIFQTKAEKGKLNSWELFFTQPAGISYNDVKSLPNKVIIDNPKGPRVRVSCMDNPGAQEYWKLITSKFIHPTDEVQSIIDKYDNVFEGHRVLGIIARGTDYKLNVAVNHPIQPSSEELIHKAHEFMDKYKLDRIFLATEDQHHFDALSKEFGDILFSIPQKRYEEEITDKLGHLKDYADYSKEMNKAYLASLYSLGKCKCLISGEVGGLLAAFLFSEGYEELYKYELGSFNMDDEVTCNVDEIRNFNPASK